MNYRYFVQLSYNGKAYHGWQMQDNAITVQEVLNKGLTTLLREEINVVGAGRTDTGVHARYFMAHFDLAHEISDKGLILNRINKVLPHDIAVANFFKMSPQANARFDATARTYEYHIARAKNPFLTDFAWHYKVPLDIEKMNDAAKALFDYTDFTSFSKLGTQVATNNCKIFHAEWTENDYIICFTISADRFLRNMVRAIVGTLIEVGLGKIDINRFREIIELKNRNLAGFSVPAHGLYLTDIQYPEDIFIDKIKD